MIYNRVPNYIYRHKKTAGWAAAIWRHLISTGCFGINSAIYIEFVLLLAML